jgi:hypothetical protein
MWRCGREPIRREQGFHVLAGRETPDALAEILKRIAMTGEQARYARHDLLQIENIYWPQQRQRGQREVEHKEVTARTQHPRHFANRVGPGRHVTETEGDRNDIERRINDGHRIVYRVEGDSLLIAQLRFHY